MFDAAMTSGEAAFDGQPGPPTLGRIEIAGLKLFATFEYANFLARASHARCSDAAAVTRTDNHNFVIALEVFYG